MKVLILGTGKTGTTVMVYKVSGGLPDCHAFSGGYPGKHLGDYENAVYKHTYNERKGKSMELIGYDCDDWRPDPNPVIESEFSSVYMQNLPHKASKNKVLRYFDSVTQKLKKR